MLLNHSNRRLFFEARSEDFSFLKVNFMGIEEYFVLMIKIVKTLSVINIQHVLIQKLSSQILYPTHVCPWIRCIIQHQLLQDWTRSDFQTANSILKDQNLKSSDRFHSNNGRILDQKNQISCIYKLQIIKYYNLYFKWTLRCLSSDLVNLNVKIYSNYGMLQFY